MANDNARLKPITELVSLARQHAIQALPLETRQSYPIPVLLPDGLRVEFVFCTQRARPGSIQLFAPEQLLIIRATSGAFEPLKNVTPRDFGRSDPEGDFIGEHKLPPGMSYEESLVQQKKLFDEYDIVLPAFAKNSTQVSPQTKAAAADFKKLFEKLAERPLIPYYHIIGKDFFAWLDKVSA